MPALEDIGAAYKKQNPGVYDDMDNATVGAAYQKAHPGVYDDIKPATSNQPTPAQPQPPQRSFLDNLKNSTANFVGNLPAGVAAAGSAIMHPADTVDQLSSIGGGLIQRGARAVGINMPGKGGEDDQKAGALIDALKQRYGSLDALKHTAYTDPVGFAADASMLLGGGAAGLRAGMSLTRTARLMKTADVLGTLSDAVNPLLAPGNALKAAGSGLDAAGDAASRTGLTRTGAALTKAAGIVKAPLAKAKNAAAEDLYQSAVRPSPSLGPETQNAVVQMGLANNIPANEQAPARARAIANGANRQITDKLAASSAQIDPNQVAAIARQSRPNLTSVDPGSDMSSFDNTIQRYLDQHTPAQPQALPPSNLLGSNGQPLPAAPAPPSAPQQYPIQQGQAEKTGTYRKLGDNSYGDQSGASTEAMKGLARGLRQSIESFFPEVANLNQTQANAIASEQAFSDFVAREGNQGTLLRFLRPSLASSSIAGLAFAGEHSIPVAIAGHLVTKALEDPGIRSRIAIGLYNSANNPASPIIRRAVSPMARIAEVHSEVSHPAVASGALSGAQPQDPSASQ